MKDKNYLLLTLMLLIGSMAVTFADFRSAEEKSAEISVRNKIRVNLNEADIEDLMNIPYIGEKKARDILEFREKNLFQTAEDIMKIKGIKKQTFEKMKEYIYVSQ